ncbi:unnamed protein product [Amoebophrya sp. A120]|nr:unnamed protein product [Amoebophrya sp. A120]|eukprot:GSA120T00021107001.1
MSWTTCGLLSFLSGVVILVAILENHEPRPPVKNADKTLFTDLIEFLEDIYYTEEGSWWWYYFAVEEDLPDQRGLLPTAAGRVVEAAAPSEQVEHQREGRFFPKRLCIYDVLDDYSGFSTWALRTPSSSSSSEQEEFSFDSSPEGEVNLEENSGRSIARVDASTTADNYNHLQDDQNDHPEVDLHHHREDEQQTSFLTFLCSFFWFPWCSLPRWVKVHCPIPKDLGILLQTTSVFQHQEEGSDDFSIVPGSLLKVSSLPTTGTTRTSSQYKKNSEHHLAYQSRTSAPSSSPTAKRASTHSTASTAPTTADSEFQKNYLEYGSYSSYWFRFSVICKYQETLFLFFCAYLTYLVPFLALVELRYGFLFALPLEEDEEEQDDDDERAAGGVVQQRRFGGGFFGFGVGNQQEDESESESGSDWETESESENKTDSSGNRGSDCDSEAGSSEEEGTDCSSEDEGETTESECETDSETESDCSSEAEAVYDWVYVKTEPKIILKTASSSSSITTSSAEEVDLNQNNVGFYGKKPITYDSVKQCVPWKKVWLRNGIPLGGTTTRSTKVEEVVVVVVPPLYKRVYKFLIKFKTVPSAVRNFCYQAVQDFKSLLHASYLNFIDFFHQAKLVLTIYFPFGLAGILAHSAATYTTFFIVAYLVKLVSSTNPGGTSAATTSSVEGPLVPGSGAGAPIGVPSTSRGGPGPAASATSVYPSTRSTATSSARTSISLAAARTAVRTRSQNTISSNDFVIQTRQLQPHFQKQREEADFLYATGQLHFMIESLSF